MSSHTLIYRQANYLACKKLHVPELNHLPDVIRWRILTAAKMQIKGTPFIFKMMKKGGTAVNLSALKDGT